MLVRFYNRVYDQLANRADDHSHNRAADQPECFVMRLVLVDQAHNAWHLFQLYVNDMREPGVMRVEEVQHERRPII